MGALTWTDRGLFFGIPTLMEKLFSWAAGGENTGVYGESAIVCKRNVEIGHCYAELAVWLRAGTWLTDWGRRFSAASLRHRCLFFAREAFSLAYLLLQYEINEINASSFGSRLKIIVPPFCSKPRTRFNPSLPAFNDIHESIAHFFTNSRLLLLRA